MNAQQQLIGVFGLGVSGMAAARYLEKTQQDFFVADTREQINNHNVLNTMTHCKATYFKDIPQQVLNTAKKIIVSPGVPPSNQQLLTAQDNKVSVIGDIEIFAQSTKGKIVAITGSNGKSTVTDLTYKILRAGGYNVQIGGNIGVPVLDFLPEDKAEYYVLELSSFQLDTTYSLSSEVATILNISEDHMDRYADFESYQKSKHTIFNNAKKTVINADDPLTFDTQETKNITFSLQNSSSDYHLKNIDGDNWLVANDQAIVKTKDLSMVGEHNCLNALAAIALVSELGFTLNKNMLTALKEYQGLSHRFQLVKSENDIDWINDSKATNVGATLAALNGIDKTIYSSLILIAGGDAKGNDLLPLKKALNDKVDTLILLGKDAQLLAKIADKCHVVFAENMQHAIEISYQEMSRKKEPIKSMVLLSPACSSLDQYSSFVARGDAFVNAVGGLYESA